MYLLNTNKTLQRIHTLMLFLFQTMNIILFCLDKSENYDSLLCIKLL